MNKRLLIPAAILLCVLLTGCGDGGYRTDFPPPAGTEKPAGWFPAKVGGVDVKIEPLTADPTRYQGTSAFYGGKAKIVIIQTKDGTALDEYVKSTAVPHLAKFSTRSSGKVNGVWKLRGNGSSGRIYGWQNGAWIFSVEAADDSLFDEAVAGFPFISKK